ncbi:unnamed protein product [Moneuplotes crassus]|uniref:Uncharacterized protein n=1 Tax=Euplotes crassus TaxID=5936 RepID=A0AAD1XK64_EUPCR|nr:unnamed protein product [Moneuplotes crassus]
MKNSQIPSINIPEKKSSYALSPAQKPTPTPTSPPLSQSFLLNLHSNLKRQLDHPKFWLQKPKTLKKPSKPRPPSLTSPSNPTGSKQPKMLMSTKILSKSPEKDQIKLYAERFMKNRIFKKRRMFASKNSKKNSRPNQIIYSNNCSWIKDSAKELSFVKTGKAFDPRALSKKARSRTRRGRCLIRMLNKQDKGHSRAVSAIPYEHRRDKENLNKDMQKANSTCLSNMLARGGSRGNILNQTQNNFRAKLQIQRRPKNITSRHLSNPSRLDNPSQRYCMNRLDILSQCNIDWNTNV